MATTPQVRFRSGDICTQAGSYSFDGYADGDWEPAPDRDQTVIDVNVGQPFPSPAPGNKPCWWTWIGADEHPIDEE